MVNRRGNYHGGGGSGDGVGGTSDGEAEKTAKMNTKKEKSKLNLR